MSQKNSNEKQASSALVLVDVMNDLDFEGNERLVSLAPTLAENIARAKEIACRYDLPVIYVNDNFGKWRSNMDDILEFALKPESKGRALAEKLRPHEDDYFVLKPMHSAFYGTPFEILLGALKVKRIILTGIAADMCVLYTANDAYMRHFEIVVLSDCVESNSKEEKNSALEHIEKRLKAEVITVDELENSIANLVEGQ